MKKMQTTHKGHFAILEILSKVFGVVTGTGSILELMGELITKQTDKMLTRILGLAVMGFTLLAGIGLLAAGGILLLIDFTVIPRGVAFVLCGFILVLGSAFFLQLSKK